MLTLFRHIRDLREPPFFTIQYFCDMTFKDLDENPGLDAQVTEIRHFKEKVTIFRENF